MAEWRNEELVWYQEFTGHFRETSVSEQLSRMNAAIGGTCAGLKTSFKQQPHTHDAVHSHIPTRTYATVLSPYATVLSPYATVLSPFATKRERELVCNRPPPRVDVDQCPRVVMSTRAHVS
jgi:hypothetical protein